MGVLLPPALNLAGQTFGRLTVLERVENTKGEGRSRWLCRCSCEPSKDVIVIGKQLVDGYTKSCGCLHTKHGQARHGNGKKPSLEYRTWQGLIRRCTNPKNKDFECYGGRGITVADRWQGEDGFKNFFADMGPKPEPKHLYSIDRINSNGNYEPSNCRWATIQQQNRNKSDTKLTPEKVRQILDLNAMATLTQREIAEQFDVSYSVVCNIVNGKAWLEAPIPTITVECLEKVP